MDPGATPEDEPAGERRRSPRIDADVDPALDVVRRIGDYRILGEIGRGGMGRVLHVEHDKRPGEDLALKLVHAGLTSRPRAMERFRREGQALARLRHPGVVRVVDHGVVEHEGAVDSLPFIVMERIEGGSLSERIQEARARWRASGENAATPSVCLALPDPVDGSEETVAAVPETARGPRGVARLVARLARAVAAAHAEGVLHRDIKPSNVIVRSDGSPVLIDFGLMRQDDLTTLTHTGDTIGTPQYMAPEQARGERADRRADVYAVGSILYELLTLELPRAGTETLVVLRDAGLRPLIPPHRRAPGLPPALATIARRATSFHRRWRYAEAADLAEDLEAFLDGRPIGARPPGGIERAALAWLNHKRSIVAGAFAVLLLAVLASRFAAGDDREARIHDARKYAVAAWLAGDEERAREQAAILTRWSETRDEGRFLLGLAGDPLPGDSDDAMIQALVRGERHRREGNLREAATHLHAAVNIAQKTPRSLTGRVLVGITERDLGRPLQGARYFSHCTTLLEEASPEIHRMLGLAYIEGGESYGAVVALTTSLSLEPDHGETWLALARARLANEEPREALEAARRALDCEGAALEEEAAELARALQAAGYPAQAEALSGLLDPK